MWRKEENKERERERERERWRHVVENWFTVTCVEGVCVCVRERERERVCIRTWINGCACVAYDCVCMLIYIYIICAVNFVLKSSPAWKVVSSDKAGLSECEIWQCRHITERGKNRVQSKHVDFFDLPFRSTGMGDVVLWQRTNRLT